MTIIQEASLNRFTSNIEGNIAGFITYSIPNEGQLLLEHTEVDAAFGGQGIGKKILLEIVAYARKNNLKIIPACSYVQSVFDKNEEIRDVLIGH